MMSDSSAMYFRRQTCRLCNQRRLQSVLELTPTPLANAFVRKTELANQQPIFPLNVFQCSDCGHSQLLDVVDPSILFKDYVYVSGTSPSFVRHFESYAQDILSRFKYPPSSLVVDVGSNDGTLLKFFKAAGLRVLGIEPAVEISKAANASGIDTLNRFLSAELANDLRKSQQWSEKGGAAIVTANNVFAHVDDLKGFVDAVKGLLAADGIFVFEVSYLGDVIRDTLFDTIYHEHLSYHAVTPLIPFFERNGMAIISVQKVKSHGGSVRVVVQRQGGKHRADSSVAEIVAEEKALGLDRPDVFRALAKQISEVKQELLSLLHKLKSSGARIAGYGAPAKATTLMFHFDIGPDIIDFIVDDSPLKQGLYSPASHIPILPPKALEEHNPDYLLVLAWNFADAIVEKSKAFRDKNGKFIIPLPKVRMV